MCFLLHQGQEESPEPNPRALNAEIGEVSSGVLGAISQYTGLLAWEFVCILNPEREREEWCPPTVFM